MSPNVFRSKNDIKIDNKNLLRKTLVMLAKILLIKQGPRIIKIKKSPEESMA